MLTTKNGSPFSSIQLTKVELPVNGENDLIRFEFQETSTLGRHELFISKNRLEFEIGNYCNIQFNFFTDRTFNPYSDYQRAYLISHPEITSKRNREPNSPTEKDYILFLINFIRLACKSSKHYQNFQLDPKILIHLELAHKIIHDFYQITLQSNSQELLQTVLVCVPNFTEDSNFSPTNILQKESIYYKSSTCQFFIVLEERSHYTTPKSSYCNYQLKFNGQFTLQFLLKSGRIAYDITALNFQQADFQKNNLDRYQLLSLLHKYQYSIVMVEGYEANVNRYYHPVQSIQSWTSLNNINHNEKLITVTISSPPKKDRMGACELSFNASKELKSYQIFNDLFYNPKIKELILHNYYDDINQLGKIISPYDNHLDNMYFGNKLVSKILSGSYKVNISDHEHLLETINKLRKNIKDHLIDLEAFKPIKAEFKQINIDLSDESYSFFVQYEINSESNKDNIYLANYTKIWGLIFQVLDGGLGSLANKHIKDYLGGNKLKTRPLILKLLRHSGIGVYFIYTLLKSIHETHNTQTNSLDLNKHKDFKKFLSNEFSSKAMLLLQSSTKSEESIIDLNLFTPKLIDFLKELAKEIICENSPEKEEILYYNHTLYKVQGLSYNQSKIIYNILDYLVTSTSGDLFRSSKNKYIPLAKTNHRFSTDPFEAPISLTTSVYEHDEKDSALTEAYSQSLLTKNSKAKLLSTELIGPFSKIAHVTYNGKPIEELTASNFSIEFSLTNVNDDASPTNSSSPILNKPINWFDLHPQYFLNGKLITGETAKLLLEEAVVEHDGKFYIVNTKKLPTYKALEVFWNKLSSHKKYQSGINVSKSSSQKEKTQRHHILELLALRNMGIAFQGPPEWDQICRYFDGLSHPQQKITLSKPLEEILKPYQKNGVQWLWDLYHLKIGGVLADDMGLGKTIQTLTFINELKLKQKPHKTLVVVPVSLVYNWQSEAQKFTKKLQVEIFDPAKTMEPDSSTFDILICTYGLLPLHKEKLNKFNFEIVIFDEAQNLKNRTTERSSAAADIAAPFKVALTGTPLENHLSNLYSLFSVVAPGVLGSYAEFSKSYIGQDPFIIMNLDFLKAQLKPLMLRRTKEQLLPELPEKTETQIVVDFTKKQKELYKKTALAYSEKINSLIEQNGENQSKLHMLSALLRLRQICSDPSGLPNVAFKDIPPKLEYLFDQLEEIIGGGHSVVVFTQFLSTYNRIRSIAQDKKLPLFSMSGSDSRATRVDTLTRFNELNSGAILLMTLKTGGVGLNLTKANYVFHIDPWWNPAVENQATDRVHRIGQTKSISVYRLIMKESVEEKVELLKLKKGALFNSMFGENYFSNETGDFVTNSKIEIQNTNISSISKSDFDALLN